MKTPNKLAFIIAWIIDIIILGIHTYYSRGKSDYVTILLLLILILIPSLPFIRFLRWRDFEAEISDKEVSDLDKASESIPEPRIQNDPYEIFTQQLFTIGSHNIGAAILALRIEVERVLRDLYKLTKKKDPVKVGSVQILELLKKNRIVLEEQYIAIKQYLLVFNKVSHGESITLEQPRDFEIFVLSGIRLLRFLYSLKENKSE